MRKIALALVFLAGVAYAETVKKKMILCVEDTSTVVKYIATNESPPVGCREVLSEVTMNESGQCVDVALALTLVCSPCVVSDDRTWGACPHCLSWPGGCTAACPVEEGPP